MAITASVGVAYAKARQAPVVQSAVNEHRGQDFAQLEALRAAGF